MEKLDNKHLALYSKGGSGVDGSTNRVGGASPICEVFKGLPNQP